jgi:hypothetical protein
MFGAGLSLRAQTAQISGLVQDSSGSMVAHVHVRAINQETLVDRHATTNAVGLYVLPFLDPGQYQLVIECPGFQTAISEKLPITVDQLLIFNVRLQVGSIHETVKVNAESLAIDTSSAEVSNVVSEHQLKNLPLILRDPFQLILLSTGVNATNSGGGGFSVNGGREENNDLRLDGASNNDVEVPSAGIAPINPDAIQEFRVITNGYMPEFGRNNGAIVNIVTKSGANDLHGSVYGFGRYAFFGARDFFNKAGIPKDGYTRNEFGTSLGGPIVKRRTFFFFNYEGSRFATTRTNSSIVPTKALLSGQFTFTKRDPHDAGNLLSVPIDVSRPDSPMNIFHLSLDPIVRKVLGSYPAPTVPLGNGLQGELFFASRDITQSNAETVRIDHNFSSSEALAVRYIAGGGAESNPFNSNVLPSVGSISDNGLIQLLSVHLTSNFRNNWLNDFVADGNRFRFAFSCGGINKLDSVLPNDRFGNGFDLSWPAGIAPWGCASLGDSKAQDRASGAYTFSDQMAWVAGQHTMKVGLEFADSYSNNLTGFQSRPMLSFNNFTSFGIPAIRTGVAAADTDPTLQDTLWALFGEVSFERASQFFSPSGTRLPTDELNMRAHDFAVFAQDAYRVLPNLSLNYGLRWNFSGVPYDAHNRLFTVTPQQLSGAAPVTFQNFGKCGLPLYSKEWFAFQPRIGTAWDPFRSGKTSIRASYGIYHDRSFFAIVDSARTNPPLTEALSSVVFEPTATGFVGTALSNLQPPASARPTATVGPMALLDPTVIDPKLRLPYSQNWNVGVQREAPGNLLLDINYVGVQGKRLFRLVDGNQPIPRLVAQLRGICSHPNPLNCIDSPSASTVQGSNLFDGAELGLLPFDAVNNNAFFHATLFESTASSNYNALQSMVTKRFSQGIFVQAAYTWAHQIDDAAAPIGPTVNNQAFPADSYDLRREHGNGSQDIRHALVVNYIAELPLGSGKVHLNRGFAGRVLEGWSLSGITTLSGGFPYDILTLRDSNGTGGLALTRADYSPRARPSIVGNAITLTGPNPGLFSTPPFGRPGNLSRNVFRVPGINNWDAAWTKHSKINERVAVEFRTEIYNLFNRVRFSPPDNIVESPSFGQSTSQVGRNDGTSGARQLQFGLRVIF